MVELKPCPFCGGRARYAVSMHMNGDTTKTHKVMCEDVFRCGAEMIDIISPYQRDYDDAVEALKQRWNNRVPQTAAHTPMTNGDRIRSMTDEKLGAVIAKMSDCGNGCPAREYCMGTTMLGCTNVVIEWLKQPVEGGEEDGK